MQTFRRRRAGLSATAGLSCLLCDACSAKCSIAVVSHLSIRLSVSVTLMYYGQMCWVSMKLITRIISLGLEPQYRQSSPRGTPQNLGGIAVGVALRNRKPAMSLKRGKIGPRLLLMTNVISIWVNIII